MIYLKSNFKNCKKTLKYQKKFDNFIDSINILKKDMFLYDWCGNKNYTLIELNFFCAFKDDFLLSKKIFSKLYMPYYIYFFAYCKNLL